MRSVRNKTFILLYNSKDLDFLFLTETWLEPSDSCFLTELLPVNCNVLNSPRLSGRGGGVATLFKGHFKCSVVSVGEYSSFEVQLFKLNLAQTLYCALTYRPPKYNKDFTQDFADFFLTHCTYYGQPLNCWGF